MDKVLMIAGIGALLLIFIFPFLPIGTRPRCPECGSRKIGVNKTNKGFRTTGLTGGGSGGGEEKQRHDKNGQPICRSAPEVPPLHHLNTLPVICRDASAGQRLI